MLSVKDLDTTPISLRDLPSVNKPRPLCVGLVSFAPSVDDAVDCPVEVPAWLMGLCRFLGDLPCWMPRGAVIEGKGAGCD